MMQVNNGTGKSRAIRAPSKWKAPTQPLVPPGKTTVVNVPRGAPGTTIQVPYPGKAMLVPVPDSPAYATTATVDAHGSSASAAPSG